MANFNVADYVPVNERLAKFYVQYPNGRITTSMLEHDPETGLVIFKADVFRSFDDAQASATGHAFEERSTGYVNKTSYIENCETSAVGRALAMLGFEISKSIASRQEMEKVKRMEEEAAIPLEVVKEEGQYRVGPFTVTKPNGKVVCSCKKRDCEHLKAVRRFAAAEGDQPAIEAPYEVQ